MNRDAQAFARGVKARMVALDMSQAELARRLRKPPSNISERLKGVKVPRPETVAEYAEALETVPSALFVYDTSLPLRDPTPEETLSRVVARMGIAPERERIIQKALFAEPALLLKFQECLEGA